jgi:hypothetical protein
LLSLRAWTIALGRDSIRLAEPFQSHTCIQG